MISNGDPSTFESEVEVTVANLEVFVRDDEGTPVDGLTADDFRILQDGVEMSITNFSFVSPSTPEPLPTQSPSTRLDGISHRSRPRVEPGYVALVFDNENLHPLDRTRVMNGIRTFVDDVMAADVRVMVVTTRRSVAVRQQFTADREAVVAALDRVSEETGARMAIEIERRRLLNDMERFARESARESFVDFMNSVNAQVFKAQIQARINSHIEEESGILQDTLRNLREVIRLVSDTEGRRSIVYVSNGLPMTPGLELMHEFAEVFFDTTIYARIAQRTYATQFHALADIANRAGVSLYTIDASGLRPPLGFGAGPDDQYVPSSTASWVATSNQQESITYVADATGGVAIVNTNDVTDDLKVIRDDLATFYSIGYRLASTGSDTAHQIEVQLPNHPDYHVRHQKWFVEESLETKVRERVLQALIRDIDSNPIGLRLSAGDPTQLSARRWEVPVTLSIPVNRLRIEPDGDALIVHLELYVCVRDERGRESPMHYRQLDLRFPQAGFSPVREQRYEVSLPMIFREERHAVAVGLVDRGTQQTAFARTMVDVP